MAVNPISAHAHVLVKSMENVILSIINAHAPGICTTSVLRDMDGLSLEDEAQKLASALERFISAILRPQISKQTITESEKAIIISRDVPAIVTASESEPNLPGITQVSHNRMTPPKSQFLKDALKRAHHRVFNKMPIRLLAFKPDGSGIELLERSTVFGRISIAMESDIHKANADDTVEEFILRYTQYAILSHTWLRDTLGEVTYATWKAREFDHGSLGYQKLANFCRTAATVHRITFGWMDTVCINKDSSAELDESIRSMYTWYADASVCITYLAQTTAVRHMHKDSWFTRGWTLQEFLAPQSVEFYGANWQRLPQTDDIWSEILVATGISKKDRESLGKSRHSIPISNRMRWAANRQVTREEDIAYSLMGIFDVSLSIAYGEGSERAFVRLLKEVMNLAGVSTLDILNWGSGNNALLGASSTISSVIPSSPKQYLARSELVVCWPTLRTPVTLTHLGLHVSLLLMPAVSADPHWPSVTIGQFYASANVELLGQQGYYDGLIPVPKRFNVLDRASMPCATSCGWSRSDAQFYIIFGLLNFMDNGDSIILPSIYKSYQNVAQGIGHSHGFALCFIMASGKLQRIPTKMAVTLDIETHKSPEPSDPSNIYAVPKIDRYEIPKSELGEHGMELHTVYL